MIDLLHWDIYEISSSASLQGVMLRGRLRKFANQKGLNLLTENDEGNFVVRFALISGTDPAVVINFIGSMVPGAIVERVRENIPNPVLSKLQINIDDRYTINTV